MILNLDSKFNPIAGEEIQFDAFSFSGGEPHIKIQPFDSEETVIVTHRINSFNDLGLLCVTVDALRRMYVRHIELFLPYFPGARQDRVMVPGESLTVKVYADLINALNLDAIIIFDPHSDVTPALLNSCQVIQNFQFVRETIKEINQDLILISPDAGAAKKIHKLATFLNMQDVLECGKVRDVKTGALSGFHVPEDDLQGKSCLIVDDICDGGGTFLGLAKELKKKNAGDLYLAVSHGIFSKGTQALTESFAKVFTTNTVKDIQEVNVHQFKIAQLLNQ